MLAEVLQWAPDGWIWVYFISSSSILYMELDLGRWFIARSLRRSWWGSGGRGDCRATAPKVWKKPWHQVLHPGHPAPASICATLQRDSRLLGKASSGDVCTDWERHHTNASMRDCLGHHARALPARQPPLEPAPGAVVPVLGSWSQVLFMPQRSSQRHSWCFSLCSSCVLISVAFGWGIMACWARELGWDEVMVVLLFLSKALAFFWVIILLLVPGLQQHQQHPHESTEILHPGSGTMIRRRAPGQLTGRKKVLLKVCYKSLTVGIQA